jgi:hypothetical protein
MNKGRRPAARDGHTGVLVLNKYFLVFGGDRHRMPFNDLYVLDMHTEYMDNSYIFEHSGDNTMTEGDRLPSQQTSVLNL